MSWRNSLHAAIRELKKEEQILASDLGAVRQKIDDLTALTRSAEPRARGRKTAPDRNRLSPKGRAAISRAAKKRWAKYRAQQSKQ